MKHTKRLTIPDGTTTTDPDMFTAEWDKIRKPFEKIGFKVGGFSLYGITLILEEKLREGYFTIPICAAQKIIKAIERNAD